MPIVMDRTPDIGFPLGLFSVGLGFLVLALLEHVDFHGICKFCKSIGGQDKGNGQVVQPLKGTGGEGDTEALVGE